MFMTDMEYELEMKLFGPLAEGSDKRTDVTGDQIALEYLQIPVKAGRVDRFYVVPMVERGATRRGANMGRVYACLFTREGVLNAIQRHRAKEPVPCLRGKQGRLYTNGTNVMKLVQSFGPMVCKPILIEGVHTIEQIRDNGKARFSSGGRGWELMVCEALRKSMAIDSVMHTGDMKRGKNDLQANHDAIVHTRFEPKYW